MRSLFHEKLLARVLGIVKKIFFPCTCQLHIVLPWLSHPPQPFWLTPPPQAQALCNIVAEWRERNIAAKKWQCPCGKVLPITMGPTTKAFTHVHCKGEQHKDWLQYIFAIFTILAPFGPFVDVYSCFFCAFFLCFSKLFERFMWFSLAIAFFFGFWFLFNLICHRIHLSDVFSTCL